MNVSAPRGASNSHAWLPLRPAELRGGLPFLGPPARRLPPDECAAAHGQRAPGLRRAGVAGAAAGTGVAGRGGRLPCTPSRWRRSRGPLGRRDVLYAFFFPLLAFLAFVAHERRRGRRRWVLYGLSLACLTASLLSKASAMTLPAALGLALFAFGNSEGSFWRRMAWTLPHWVVAMVTFSVVHWLVARQAEVVKGHGVGCQPGQRAPDLRQVRGSFCSSLSTWCRRTARRRCPGRRTACGFCSSPGWWGCWWRWRGGRRRGGASPSSASAGGFCSWRRWRISCPSACSWPNGTCTCRSWGRCGARRGDAWGA